MSPSDLQEVGGYASLGELQTAHVALVKEVGANLLAPAAAAAITELVRRATLTGKVLDDPDDRIAAQGLINFWAARLGSASRAAGRKMSGEPSPEPGVPLPQFEETTLATFDEKTLDAVTEAADRWLKGLPENEQTAARRVAMRLVRLGPEGREVTPFPIPRAVLHDADMPEQVDRVIEGLAAAGVVRVKKGPTPDADQVAMRAPGLVQRWSAMKDWVKRRLEFRERVEAWKRNGQPPEMLLSDEALDEVRAYHDRNTLERAFIDESRVDEREATLRARAKMWRNGAIAVVAVLSLIAVSYWFWMWRVTSRARADAGRMRQAAMKAQALAESGSTLILIELLGRGEVENSHHLAKKLLIIQTLGQMVSSASDPIAWQAAWANWDVLKANLKDDDAIEFWFRDTFFPDKATKRDPTTNEQRIEKLTASRENSRTYRDELLYISKYLARFVIPESERNKNWYWKVKRRWYDQAKLAASALAVAADNDRTIEEAAAFNDLFWRLYLGEMVLVETKPVEAKMVQFGQALKRWEEGGGTASPALQADLANAAKELHAACDGELKQEPPVK